MTDTARPTATTPSITAPPPRREPPIAARRAPDSVTIGGQPVIGCRIDVSGRSFTVELEMAGIFLRGVRRTLRDGSGGLVLLRHVDGIEMIPFTRATPFEVGDIICPEGVEPNDARAAAGLRAR